MLREFAARGQGLLVRPGVHRDLSIEVLRPWRGCGSHFLSTVLGSQHSPSPCFFTRTLRRQVITSRFTEEETEPLEGKS